MLVAESGLGVLHHFVRAVISASFQILSAGFRDCWFLTVPDSDYLKYVHWRLQDKL